MTAASYDRNSMNISERFIRAAFTDDKRKVSGVRPAGFGSAMPSYVHSYADMNGWRREPGDKLKVEDFDRHGNHRREQFDIRRSPISAADISDLDECQRWVAEFVPDEANRRALWKWAYSKIGKCYFIAWCFQVEGIHPETGRRRKNRAISQIELGLARKLLQNNEMQAFRVLLDEGRNAYLEPTLEDVAPLKKIVARPFNDPSLRPIQAPRFSWGEERKEMRRVKARR